MTTQANEPAAPEAGVVPVPRSARDKKEKTDRGFRSEFRYGKFVRQVRLPKGTGSEVTADYRAGVLEVRMPKPSSEGTARRIEIGAADHVARVT